MAAADHQASDTTKHKILRGSPENATAPRSTTHLRGWVSHFSDGLTALLLPLSLRPSPSLLSVPPLRPPPRPPFPPSTALRRRDPPLRERRRRRHHRRRRRKEVQNRFRRWSSQLWPAILHSSFLTVPAFLSCPAQNDGNCSSYLTRDRPPHERRWKTSEKDPKAQRMRFATVTSLPF